MNQILPTRLQLDACRALVEQGGGALRLAGELVAQFNSVANILGRGLAEAQKLVKEGHSPEAAIAKVGEDLKLTPEQRDWMIGKLK